MEVVVKYVDKHKFIAKSGKHQIIIDQPKEQGGDDEGMSPLEIFLVSLGACAGVYAGSYCRNAKIDVGNLKISVNSELCPDAPKRFKEIKVNIDLGQPLGERKTALLNFVKNCPVHNTLAASPGIELGIRG